MSLSVMRGPRSTFLVKAILAAVLVALADWLFFCHPFGASLGAFGLTLLLAALIAHPALRRNRVSQVAVLAALLLGLLLIEAPSFPVWVLFWCALMAAVLAPRAGLREDAWTWLQRLVLVPLAALFDPILDLLSLNRRKVCRPRVRILAVLSATLLPLIGGAVFLCLFAAANPIIAQGLGHIEFPPLDIGRTIFLIACFVGVWSVLRPRYLRRPSRLLDRPGSVALLGVSVASVALSLLVFNLLFALQNGLDIAFLWSGAHLPDGMTLAQYAHGGAYTLIATALLAGLFVLIALQPGSATARRPLIRMLVVMWVGQNVFMVASSILRTLDYIDAYSLTRMRIAALAWMGLVAVGLMLICWRMLRGKSTAWLVNANVIAAGLVITACCIVDTGAVAAEWNVTHAREVGGRGAQLDVCYLASLDDSALVALAELEQRALPPPVLSRVAWVRFAIQGGLENRQKKWRGWTARGMRRLDRVRQLSAPHVAMAQGCDGDPPPVVVAPPQPAPLTSPPVR